MQRLSSFARSLSGTGQVKDPDGKSLTRVPSQIMESSVGEDDFQERTMISHNNGHIYSHGLTVMLRP